MKNNNGRSILRQVPTEEKIKRELKKVIFGGKMFCPRCGSRRIKKYEGRWRCGLCRKPFSITSVSWLKGMKLPFQTFWLLLWAWTKKTPVDQARELCGVSLPTARRWYEKFRTRLPQEKIERVRLSGTVQMDEAYRGGKIKGFSILAAKEKIGKNSGKKRRKMAIEILDKSSVGRTDAVHFLSQRVKPDSDLHTDGGSIYKGIAGWWPVNHRYEVHSKWEFSLTSEIEGLFGNLTTFIRGMYHHTTRDKVRDIAQEFVARSVFPDWFATPNDYIAVAVPRITRPKRPEWRGAYQRKQKPKSYDQKTDENPFTCWPKLSTPVPY